MQDYLFIQHSILRIKKYTKTSHHINIFIFSIIIFISNYFIMANRQHLPIFVLILLTLSFSHQQQIVDFTYSKYLQADAKDSAESLNIQINPDQHIIQDYDFPSSCYSAKVLTQSQVQPTDALQSLDIDAIVDGLKVEFIELLKISQKIKKKKLNIEELGSISKRGETSTVVNPEQLQLLKKYEERLGKINSQIQDNSAILQSLVYDSLKNSENNQFVESAINFEIQSLNIKLKYLRDLKLKAEKNEKTNSVDDYDTYFGDLKRKFEEENDLVKDLNSILQNYNEIGILKAKITNLKGKIQAIDLMLDQKQGCIKQIQEIKKSQKNEGQIQSLMNSLREKKKDINAKSNKYCEGVAKKLEDRVRKLLKIYDYTFECAEGYDELKDKKIFEERELKAAQKRLAQLEDTAGIDDYKRKFEENRKFVEGKYNEIKTFKIGQYSHDVDQIRNLIHKTEEELDNAKKKRHSLPGKRQNNDVDYQRIQDLVNQIKRLKGSYCRQYDLYESKSHEIWRNVRQFESQIEYEGKINHLYQDEINELRNLQISFETLRNSILQKIK